MNTLDSAPDLDASAGTDAAHATGLAHRSSSSHAIAGMAEANVLAPAQLERRRLIHRDESVRRQSDAFREIRTRLLGLADGQNFVTLLVAVSPRSGSSFVARNLAAAFAFDETKTSLLIDCNLRYPGQHKALGVEPVSGGLIEYLDEPERGIEPMIYQTGIPRMRLIPAGRARENGAEYFSSVPMRSALDALRNRYPDRYIFLDGPAIEGSPDARILSDLADFVVVVAGYGRDAPKAISQAAAGFDPGKFAGVVFNHAP